MKGVYRLQSAEFPGAVHLAPSADIPDPYQLLKGRPVAGPLVFSRARGRVWTDLIDTGLAVLYVLSERVLAGLSAERISGWARYEVTILARGAPPPCSYACLSVTGRCGPIDETLGMRVARMPRSQQGSPVTVRRGEFFDVNTWDGSDIFSPEGTGYIFCTPRAKGCLEKLDPTNLELTPIAEIEQLVF